MEMLLVLEAHPEGVRVPVWHCEADTLGLVEAEGLRERVPVTETLTVGVLEADREVDWQPDGVGEDDVEPLCETEPEGLREGKALGVTEVEEEVDKLPVPEGQYDMVGDADSELLEQPLTLADMCAEADELPDVHMVGEVVVEGDVEALRDTEAVLQVEAVMEGLLVGLDERHSVAVPQLEAEGDAELLPDAAPLAELHSVGLMDGLEVTDSVDVGDCDTERVPVPLSQVLAVDEMEGLPLTDIVKDCVCDGLRE